MISRGRKPLTNYLQTIKGLANRSALANVSLRDDDLIIYAFNGLGFAFRGIAVAVPVHESRISFEKLHDKLMKHRTFLKA